MSQPEAPDTLADRKPQRVRHETRLRCLTVQKVERLTPHLRRVTLGGGELAGFASPGFDDHVKLFFPDADGRLQLPTLGPDGPQPSHAPHADAVARANARDYTPRHYDAAAQTLQVDFALHEAGPATRWAEQAQIGQTLGVGGPRGSFLVPTDFDWHLLIGDDTALPAIARRLAELPAGSRAVVIIEVDGPQDELGFETRADVALSWVHRRGVPAGTPGLLGEALRRRALPRGDYFAWVAAESSVAKALRTQLLAEHGAQPRWLKAAAYWKRGASGVHERIED